ncbi:sensor histidine kinase [Maliponia aquimaris]|uniref:Oxygen sensor histidine kinase NreB n=1 Tax=Maliponia aquimaris TaxID=1673631 RepID=A0A238KGG2_9RHOB|nr:sensor histidine kinase [Maliponia aquimaris]SMX41959.1 Signal transduction histidine-protein kinase/phosphatase DegS [Maliponia aquimaris]
MRTGTQPAGLSDPPSPALRDTLRRAVTAYRRQPLTIRFALVGGLVSLLGMALIGAFVGERIKSAVVRNSAISAAVYMESFIAPLSQDLAGQNLLSAEAQARLAEMLEREGVKGRILSIKIWKRGGLIAYASDPALIGQTFAPTDDLRAAWAGQLIAGFDELEHAESASERALGVPLLEVYNPIHSIGTGEVIAVAEFYQNATELQQDLKVARLTSWAVVASVAGATFLALYGIVRAGSQTIARQHGELRHRIAEITRISNQNAQLRQRVQSSSERAAALNEALLRRVGAELHDGPAQVLALANLRIGAWKRGSGDEELDMIHRALEEALSDIRGLARGLVLPELEGLSAAEAIRRAAEAHAERTQTEVVLDGMAEDGQRPGLPHLICIYRFVQEGLMNAWRHAEGRGQCVVWTTEGADLVVTVSDDGPGFDPDRAEGTGRIGLEGLRERVQSVGGSFALLSRPGTGTTLTMRLHLRGDTA